MLEDVSRSHLLEVWSAVVAAMIAATVVLRMSVTLGTGALLVTLCLIPPAIILALWPDDSR